MDSDWDHPRRWVGRFNFVTHAILTFITCGLWLALIFTLEVIDHLRWRLSPKWRRPGIDPAVKTQVDRYMRGEITHDQYREWHGHYIEWRTFGSWSDPLDPDDRRGAR